MRRMLEKVHEDRVRKLEQIRSLGIDPYGGRYDSAEAIADVLKKHEDREKARPPAARAAEGEVAALPPSRGDAAGRLILIRDMGKMIFAHIRDSSGQMQVALRKNALDDKGWALAKLLDLGDIIAVAGQVERTRTGEITIWADRLTLLCKSLLPMPEKFHGLHDTETRYRRRYLDLMTNPDSMAVFRQRIQIMNAFREVLGRRGFVEVETPVLQPIYGGAAARPFTTHHYTLDAELFLRISPELYLKRLLVGGMERVYEFSRVFRNEGIDTRHNPEFTLLELYQAYADYEVMMEITEELVSSSARLLSDERKLRAKLAELEAEHSRIQPTIDDARKKALVTGDKSEYWSRKDDARVLPQMIEAYKKAIGLMSEGKTALPYGASVIDFTPPWPRKTYDELLREHAGVSMNDPAGARKKARELGIEEANKDDAIVISEVFEATVEPALAKPDAAGVIRPVFVKDYPAGICPLTRRKADDPSVALRFELYIAGMEIANAYTELNDPAIQEANFREQLRGEGEGAAMRVLDEDFLLAQQHGMPPAGGLGIGIDRVVMLLTNTPSIRDVVLFPLLRPETKQA
jgi:lysyl-tRNA synthetase, class II